MPKHRRTPKKSGSSKLIDLPFEGEVRDLASDGRGIVSHPDGRVFFVAGCWLGERVRVKPTGRKGDLGFGVVEELLAETEGRLKPACQHHGVGDHHCGGCPWMFVDYAQQCEQKYRRVAAQAERLGAAAGVMHAIIPAPEPLGYRNRAQLKTDGSLLGYMAAGSQKLVDVINCPVLSGHNQDTLRGLRSQLPNKAWRPDRRHGVSWHTLDIDENTSSASLDARLPFRQGNSAQNAVMRDWVAAQISEFDAAAAVLELFAGGGNFTEVLAAHFNRVTAVEGDEHCLQDLALLSSDGVLAQRVDLFDQASVEGLARSHRDTQVLMLDPPRDGWRIREPLIKGMKKLEAVIYVSCDPATWSRDCRDLIAAGFSLMSVVPIDLFPQTPHVEIMSVLKRRL